MYNKIERPPGSTRPGRSGSSLDVVTHDPRLLTPTERIRVRRETNSCWRFTQVETITKIIYNFLHKASTFHGDRRSAPSDDVPAPPQTQTLRPPPSRRVPDPGPRPAPSPLTAPAKPLGPSRRSGARGTRRSHSGASGTPAPGPPLRRHQRRVGGLRSRPESSGHPRLGNSRTKLSVNLSVSKPRQ